MASNSCIFYLIIKLKQAFTHIRYLVGYLDFQGCFKYISWNIHLPQWQANSTCNLSLLGRSNVAGTLLVVIKFVVLLKKKRHGNVMRVNTYVMSIVVCFYFLSKILLTAIAFNVIIFLTNS